MFNIRGEQWQIKIVSPTHDVLRRSNGEYTLGVTDNEDKTVYIADDLDEYMLKRVLIHEICHCFIFSLDIHIDIWQEEYLCEFVSKYGEEILNISYSQLYQR